MTPTNGKKPRTTRKLMVELRNGWRAGPYTTKQLVWEHRGWAGDVIAAEFADTAKQSNEAPAWTPTSGGY